MASQKFILVGKMVRNGKNLLKMLFRCELTEFLCLSTVRALGVHLFNVGLSVIKQFVFSFYFQKHNLFN